VLCARLRLVRTSQEFAPCLRQRAAISHRKEETHPIVLPGLCPKQASASVSGRRMTATPSGVFEANWSF